MGAFILIATVTALMVLFRQDSQNKVAYSGKESNLREANEYYWLLKNNRIPVKYVIPYNWKNFYHFGYAESPVYIKVSEKNIEKARKIMMYYRAEELKKQRNIEAERNKLEK